LVLTVGAALLLAGCASTPKTVPGQTPVTEGPYGSGPLVPADRVPDFASRNFEPFARADAVGIALAQWRMFGQPVDDDPPETRPIPAAADKPERQPGLWQRVGEYWWIGQDPGEREAAWTGKHDADGHVFHAGIDAHYAWSAAFVSYVMRTAGAGTRFPYSPNHSTYVNAAALGDSPILRARNPAEYAPLPGDLICLARGQSATLRFADLPTSYLWPGHCDIVVARQAGMLSVVGGNVDDAVTMKHVPVTADGRLANPDGSIVDTRYPWLAVIEVAYDAEDEPGPDQ
jgi:hypothetical protein